MPGSPWRCGRGPRPAGRSTAASSTPLRRSRSAPWLPSELPNDFEVVGGEMTRIFLDPISSGFITLSLPTLHANLIASILVFLDPVPSSLSASLNQATSPPTASNITSALSLQPPQRVGESWWERGGCVFLLSLLPVHRQPLPPPGINTPIRFPPVLSPLPFLHGVMKGAE